MKLQSDVLLRKQSHIVLFLCSKVVLEERVQIQKIFPSLYDTIDDDSDLALQVQVRRLQPVLWPKMAAICCRLLIWNARHFKIIKALVCFNPFILPREVKFFCPNRQQNGQQNSYFCISCLVLFSQLAQTVWFKRPLSLKFYVNEKGQEKTEGPIQLWSRTYYMETLAFL